MIQIAAILAITVILPFAILFRWATDVECKSCHKGVYIEYGNCAFCNNCSHKMGDKIK